LWSTGLSYYENREIGALLDDACQNHKVVSVEHLSETEDVYDLTIDGTHNFPLSAGVFVHNSVDGDTPAAMRYTEARLSRIADEMLQDLEKETVDMTENFDGSLEEPTVMPAKLPNLLVNGSTGIAVGMATNIPPHNLGEVAQAAIALNTNPDIDPLELAKLMPGPDFPTGGIILGSTGIMQYYAGGRGRLLVRAIITREERKGRTRLIVSEIPYMVNKSDLIAQIADFVKDKRIDGISDIVDESDRDGMRIVIDLKKDATVEVVENALYVHTNLQVTFGVIMLSIVDGQPKVLGLKPILQQYLKHRHEIVRRRTAFDLKKAKEKEHLLEGLVIALDHLDAVVALIRKAKDVDTARHGLVSSFKLTEIQANAILEMRLSRLTSLEQTKVRDDLASTKTLIKDLEDILAKEDRVRKIITDELRELLEKYQSPRKTRIQESGAQDIDLEDLIEPEDVVVTISDQGYAKRVSATAYRAQGRGGKGIIASTTKEEDFIRHILVANTHSWLMIFTDKGRVYWTKAYTLPEGTRQSKGKPLVNLINLKSDEKVRAVIPVREFADDKYLLFVTRNGLLKKTVLSAYGNVRQGGIIALNLEEGDNLVNVLLTGGADTIFIASADGMAVRCSEDEVRSMGRGSTGVYGIRLEKGDAVVGAVLSRENEMILAMTENGYGKRTPPDEYRHISRGGKGVINIITSERNGKVVSVQSVRDDHDVMLISKNGITIRTPVTGISVIGRNTQGVRLMRLEGSDKLVACTVVEKEDVGETP
jgi:DNA gyrase subunit A